VLELRLGQPVGFLLRFRRAFEHASERPIDQQHIQRVRRMMELERSLTRSRQRGLSIER